MLSGEQVNEFAERGFIVVPQVVPGDVLTRAARRIDEVVAAGPPAAGQRGSHFYFLPAKDEPALMAPLTGSPAFGLAEELAGAGTLEVPGQVQVALNIPPYSHRPGRPHIDAANPEPVREPVRGTFTLLAGILMTDQLTENSGNLWAWPGTHLTHAAYFRDHGPQQFCAYPPIDLPVPAQVKGRAGDLLLAHYLLGHNIGGNYASERTRRALYFRVSAAGHASHRGAFLQDPWQDYPPVRSRPGGAARSLTVAPGDNSGGLPIIVDNIRPLVSDSVSNVTRQTSVTHGSGHLTVPGGSVHWAAEGSGPAVVAIHGAAADLRMWEDLVPALAGSYRVIRYDLRGLGQSAPPGHAYQMADDLGAVLDYFGESSAALIGFSTGGAVAVEFAARYPRRVTALVTIGAVLSADPLPGGVAAARTELSAALGAREQARERGDLAAAVAADLDVWAAAHQGQARARLEQWGMDNPYFHAGMGEHEQLGPVSDADLAAITAPALVMVGDRDVRLSQAWATHLAAAIPAARLLVMEGADHYVSTAQPDAFHAAVREFLGESGDGA